MEEVRQEVYQVNRQRLKNQQVLGDLNPMMTQ